MKKFLKLFLLIAILYPTHNLVAQEQEPIILDIHDPLQIVLAAEIGSTASVNVKITDITGSFLSSLFTVSAYLDGNNSNFRITNVQTNIENYLIDFNLEYTPRQENQAPYEMTYVVVDVSRPPFSFQQKFEAIGWKK
ncbi:MAG: hypothetical protein E6772_16540 [Dysgonomonas sp.]|nr:hypothetical protein [Dysgonomonas sp.]